MKSIEHIGLSNVVPDTATIVHSTVFGRNTHGRVADLLCAWLENESGFDATATGPLRILIAALLEVFPKKSSSFSRIEMCASGGWIHLAVRAECGIEIVSEEVERSFTQFWLNHPGIQLLKKCLFPSDHIEVRYQKTSGLMEWRVGRPAGGAEDAHESSGFLVYTDPRSDLEQTDGNYRDLGDTAYKNWLDAVYRSAGENSASGALTIRGENQAALDLAKIKVNGELIEIEERSRRLHPDLPVARDGEQIFPGGEFDPDSRSVIYNELMERIRRHETIEAELTSRIEALKHDDHRKAHEIEQLKIQRLNMIDLLHSKERDLVRRDAEYRNLKIRIEGGGSRAQAASSELDATVKAFREKAVEMYQKLKAVQIENLELEAQLRMLRHENSVESPEVGGEEFGEGTTIRPSTEDLEKKVDRLQRTLEAEKAKVKGLLDRALIAEKEAQTSAPIISDLEAKVEFQLKTSVQYKKEIDNLKLKVVQAEAEKNKVKNELLKAQAQVQTLNKRLAG